jgi:serine protease Do
MSTYDNYLQIDAPINRGNSGGPTFDMQGNVVGINDAIYSPSGGSVGIGFDVPADTAKPIVAELQKSGHITRGYIGVQVQDVTKPIADSLGLKEAGGALVATPAADGPAAKAGIHAGDVITALNGKAVKDSRALAQDIAALSPGTSVKLDVLSNGQSKTITLTLGNMPQRRQNPPA